MDNEKVQKMSFSIFDGQSPKVIPTFVEKENSGKPYLNYGIDNRFPNYLWELYLRSAVLQSICDGTADFVCGGGIKYSNLPWIERLEKHANKDGETLDDIIKKITTDYMIFGGFSMQIIYNKIGGIAELYWLDFRNVRLNKDGDKAYYSDDWIRHANDYETYDVYSPDRKKKKSCVFYFHGHKTRGIYPVPRYNGALAAIETSTEISKFHLNSILNNFSGNFIINFNNGMPSEDVQEEIERKVKEKFSGADNAGKFMIAFNDSKENGVTVERIQDDQFDKKYEALRVSTFKEIFIAFRCQPQLMGMLLEGSLFNKEEYQQAYALYSKTTVEPIQRDLTRTFDSIFEVEDSVTFEPFESTTVFDSV